MSSVAGPLCVSVSGVMGRMTAGSCAGPAEGPQAVLGEGSMSPSPRLRSDPPWDQPLELP